MRWGLVWDWIREISSHSFIQATTSATFWIKPKELFMNSMKLKKELDGTQTQQGHFHLGLRAKKTRLGWLGTLAPANINFFLFCEKRVSLSLIDIFDQWKSPIECVTKCSKNCAGALFLSPSSLILSIVSLFVNPTRVSGRDFLWISTGIFESISFSAVFRFCIVTLLIAAGNILPRAHLDVPVVVW